MKLEKMKSFVKNKMGISINEIPTIVLSLVIVGVFLVIGYKINSTMATGETNLDAKSAIGNVTAGLTTGLVNNIGLIATVIGFAVVLGAVGYLNVQSRND